MKSSSLRETPAPLQVKCGTCSKVINGKVLQSKPNCLPVLEQCLHILSSHAVLLLWFHAVPAQVLVKLAEQKRFRCPHCHSYQNFNLSAEVAQQLVPTQQQEQQRNEQLAAARQAQEQSDLLAAYGYSAVHDAANGSYPMQVPLK